MYLKPQSHSGIAADCYWALAFCAFPKPDFGLLRVESACSLTRVLSFPWLRPISG